jgi:hypothetical protein
VGLARAVARAFLGRHIAQVHARLAPKARDKITTQQLERAWTKKIQHVGPTGEITIVHHDIATSGAVVADIALGLTTGPQHLRMVILPSGELGGPAFLPFPG